MVIGFAAPAMGAAKPATPQPVAITSSSLTQSGQQLTWSVQLAQSFAPKALKGAGRSLCLLIEPATSSAQNDS